VDAARDPAVYPLLLGCKEEHQSLYEGPKGEKLALVAPHLVGLPAGSPFLPALVEQGWGKSWAVFLTSAAPAADVRKHLRRFLLVRTEAGKEMYFRFYDPRVLRVYLPTCTPEELAQFYGPITRYLLEDGDPARCAVYQRKGTVLDRTAFRVSR
jgi:hypothetical protein